MSYEDQPPPYSASNYASDTPVVTTQITVDVMQQTGHPGLRQNITLQDLKVHRMLEIVVSYRNSKCIQHFQWVHRYFV